MIDFSFDRIQKSVSNSLFKEIADVEDIYSNQIQLLNEVVITHRNVSAFIKRYIWSDENNFTRTYFFYYLSENLEHEPGFREARDKDNRLLSRIASACSYVYLYIREICKKLVDANNINNKLTISSNLDDFFHLDNSLHSKNIQYVITHYRRIYIIAANIIQSIVPAHILDMFEDYERNFIWSTVTFVYEKFNKQAIKDMMFFNKAQRYGLLRGVDIFSFDSYTFLQRVFISVQSEVDLRDKAKEYKELIKTKKIVHQHTIYEDDVVLVIKPPSHEFSRTLFGAPKRYSALDGKIKPGARWCTAATDSKHFNEYVPEYNLVYIIKKSDDTLYAIRSKKPANTARIVKLLTNSKQAIINSNNNVLVAEMALLFVNYVEEIRDQNNTLIKGTIYRSDNNVAIAAGSLYSLFTQLYGDINQNNRNKIIEFVFKSLFNELPIPNVEELIQSQPQQPAASKTRKKTSRKKISNSEEQVEESYRDLELINEIKYTKNNAIRFIEKYKLISDSTKTWIFTGSVFNQHLLHSLRYKQPEQYKKLQQQLADKINDILKRLVYNTSLLTLMFNRQVQNMINVTAISPYDLVQHKEYRIIKDTLTLYHIWGSNIEEDQSISISFYQAFFQDYFWKIWLSFFYLNEYQKYNIIPSNFDIMSFKSYNELELVLNSNRNQELYRLRREQVSKREAIKQARKNKLKIQEATIYSDDYVVVIRPPDHDFSKLHFGNSRVSVIDGQTKPGASWCTSASTSVHFDNYIKRNNLVYLNSKAHEALFAIRSKRVDEVNRLLLQDQIQEVRNREREIIEDIKTGRETGASADEMFKYYVIAIAAGLEDNAPLTTIHEIKDYRNENTTLRSIVERIYGYSGYKDNYKKAINMLFVCLFNVKVFNEE